jgi:hypothetical protein
MVAAAAIMTAVMTAEARTMATAVMALVTIALVALTMPTLSPTTLLPMPSPVLLPSPSHLPACVEKGNGEGSKRDGNGDGMLRI